jgi:hypothetical protein
MMDKVELLAEDRGNEKFEVKINEKSWVTY